MAATFTGAVNTDWNNGGNWTGGTGVGGIPSNADACTIPKNLTCKVNDTACVALSLTLSSGTTGADVGGTLVFSTTANSKLTLQKNIITTGTTTAGWNSVITMDVSASQTYTAELVINNSGSTTDADGLCTISGSYNFKGYPKKRHTVTEAALVANTTKTVNVTAADGWIVGDRLVFATTQAYSNPPKTDVVTIATITAQGGGAYSGTGPATITWTDGVGTGGAVLYAHDTACPVGNFSSNCRILSNGTATTKSALHCTINGNSSEKHNSNSYCDNVEFYKTSASGSNTACITQQAINMVSPAHKHMGVTNCAFFEWQGVAIFHNYVNFIPNSTFNVFYSLQTNANCASLSNFQNFYGCGEWQDWFVAAAQSGLGGVGQYTGNNQRRHKISGCLTSSGGSTAGAMACGAGAPIEISDCDFWSNNEEPAFGINGVTLRDCRFNSKVFSAATCGNGGQLETRTGALIKAIDCEFPAGTITMVGIHSTSAGGILINNRDGDTTVQELYQTQSTTIPAIQRDGTTKTNSTSSMRFTLNSSTAQEYEFEVLAKAGETIRLLCNVQIDSTYDDAAYTYPSITVSGLGITPVSVSATSSSISSWELLTLDATNTGAADGNLTVTLSAQSATANAKAYFSGLPVSPFVSRCRHYGYLFNETSPTRIADTLKSADYTTANGYTDFTYTWSAEYAVTASSWSGGYLTCTVASSTGLVAGGHVTITGMAPASLNATWKIYDVPGGGASFRIAMADPGTITDGVGTATRHSVIALAANSTFQKLFDSHQAKAIADVSKLVALTGAGAAGSPALFAAGNFTTSGYTLNGPGSFSMGAYTLTATLPWAYTYTGGTFAQAASTPTFSGGTLNIGAAGTYTFTMAASTLVVVTPTAPSTYDLSGCTLTGTLTVNNAAAHAITVQVPAGTTTSDTGNTGGAITFSSPTVERGIAFTGLQTGTSIQVFTSGTQTKLFGDNSTAGSTFSFDDATSGSITVDYTIQKAGYLPQRVTGVVLTGGVGAQLDVAVTQIVDRAYAASSTLVYGTAINTPPGANAVVTVGTNPTTNPGTKTFQLGVASTGQNWYSFWIEQWIELGNATGEALANVEFPLSANGPNSFTFNDGWTFSDGATSIAYLSRDGLRYLNTSDVLQKQWAAILTSGVPSGKQVRYQQSDGGTTVNAANTGNMDQLVQIYDVGVYDYRNYLVLKVQAEGYDQAEANVVTLYGTLEDQLYVVGLTPTANTVATGDPALTITISQGTYVEDGKTFSIKIVDNVTPSSGTDIMRELRYNFAAGGTYQGEDAFNWHDLVQQNGSAFKTVRGTVYGTATTKGVLVYENDGTTLHTDFTLFTADDGTTYAPVIPANAESTVLAGTRVQLYNVTAATEIDNTYVAGTSYSYTITTEASVGDTLRLRVCKKGRQSDEVSAVWAAGGVTFLVSQPEDTVYTAWGIDGDTVTEYSFDNGNFQIDANDVDGSSQKARIGAWYSAAMGSSTSGVGIASFFGALTFLSTAAIRVNVDVADVKLDNTNALVALTFTDLDVRLYRSDGSTIIAATSYTIHNDYSGVPDTVVTSDQSLNLATAEQAIDNKLSTISFSVWSYVTEGAITAVQAIRGMAAILMGKVSGAGTGTETFRDLADTKDRVVATVDTDGNRTAITRDLT